MIFFCPPYSILQIVKVSAIYPGRLAGGDESLALSSSSSSLSSEGKEKKKSEPGWHLRLLLSLEDRERTRTRLLVTETVSGIISHIIDAIPGKVRWHFFSAFLGDVLQLFRKMSGDS